MCNRAAHACANAGEIARLGNAENIARRRGLPGNTLSYPAESVVFDRVAASGDELLLGKVPPGKYAEATVRLPPEVIGDLKDISMLLTGPDNANPLLVAQQGTWIVPKPEEDIEAERRQKDAEGRIAVHVLAFLGAILLADPQEEQDAAAAGLTGGGVRVTYGVSPLVALECEVAGASSGRAEFAGVTGGGEARERRAKLGRGQCGGVLRLGREIIPTVRAGLGVQGVSHKAAAIVDGMRADGPDLAFEIDGTWYLGVGVDAKLGDNIIAGAFMSFISEASQVMGSGTSVTFQLGIHAAWTWNPNVKPAEE